MDNNNKKKKQDKKEFNQPTIALSMENVEDPLKIHHKPKFHCNISKGDHLLINFPGMQMC